MGVFAVVFIANGQMVIANFSHCALPICFKQYDGRRIAILSFLARKLFKYSLSLI